MPHKREKRQIHILNIYARVGTEMQEHTTHITQLTHYNKTHQPFDWCVIIYKQYITCLKE